MFRSCLRRPFRGSYFVTRQSSQNEGAQPLLECVISGVADWIGLRHVMWAVCEVTSKGGVSPEFVYSVGFPIKIANFATVIIREV